MVLLTTISFSQKISENKIDEFTKSKIVSTEWEKLTLTKYLSYFNFRQVDDNFYMNIKIVTVSVCSVDKDDSISFLFEDGSVLDLKNSKYAISNYGDGAIGHRASQALGLNLITELSPKDIAELKSKPVKKLRIYTSTGYFEDIVKEKNSQVFSKSLLLF